MKGTPFKFKSIKGDKVQTPKGIGQYLYVAKPNTRFAENGGAGDYSATILLTEDEAAPIIEKIEAIKNAAMAEVRASGKKAKEADMPYGIDENTGLVKLRFKKPAESTIDGKKVKNHIAVADARGNLIPSGQVPNMGSGSIIKINGFLSPWYVPALGVGVSLKLRGVQIVKLNEFSGEDAKFEAEEDEDAFEFTPQASPAGGANGVTAHSDDAAGTYDGSSDVDF
jgi:hypothetical protein